MIRKQAKLLLFLNACVVFHSRLTHGSVVCFLDGVVAVGRWGWYVSLCAVLPRPASDVLARYGVIPVGGIFFFFSFFPASSRGCAPEGGVGFEVHRVERWC